MRFAQLGKMSTSDRVDTANGIISGVSVISEGEALGHDVWIDSKTLRQVKNTAATYSGGLKVKMNHHSGLESTVGTLQNFRIKDTKVLADLHLLKTCDLFDKILEMAEKMPDSFGISIVFDNKPELIEKVNYARCEEIYSADLVDNPAANPSGLFSAKTINKNTMNKEILTALGLPDTATQEQYDAALLALAKKEKMCDCGKDSCKSCGEKNKMSAGEKEVTKKLSEFSTVLTTLTTELTDLKSGNANALALSQKAEIDHLVAEASSARKTIPFDNDDLYTVADGKVTIKMLPTQLSKVISKLQPSVAFARKQAEAPKTADGKPITDAAARVEFCKQKQAEGAAELTAFMRRQASPATN